ncbi:hypothetical protein [Halobacillus litoralis]|nr:hypothetical protein [Halobacillus litoralis]
MVTPAGKARAEDPLGQVIFLTKLASPYPRQASTYKRFVRSNNKL